MSDSETQSIKDQIKELSQSMLEAVEASKASAAVAYQASVASVKSNQALADKLDAYIKDDTEWKERAEPVIILGNNARGASKAVLYISGVIVAIGGAYEMLRNIFKK